jgi:hypothetical protein
VGDAPGDAKKGLLELDDPASDPEIVESGVTASPTPTIRPEFSPEKYAEETEFRERMPTLTDDSLLEEARLQSMRSNAPPPRPRMASNPGNTATTARPPATTARPPAGTTSRDSVVEIDTGESDLESLGVDDQIAILTVRLAPLTRVPVLAKEMRELGPAVEDPKTAYMLGFVDGILPLETIIDVTGLPEIETLRVLDRMIALGVLVFKPPRR